MAGRNVGGRLQEGHTVSRWLLVGIAGVLVVLLALTGMGGRDSAGAPNLQGDVNCDGVVDAQDVIATTQFSIGINYSGPCLSVAGDVTCNGLIDVFDALQTLTSLAGIPDGAPACLDIGATLLADEQADGGAIDLNVTARLQCSVEVPHHVLAVEWGITGVASADVTIKASYAWGTQDSLQTNQLSGQTEFTEADVGGGAVIVAVLVNAPGGEVFGAEEHLQLDSCLPPPATPQPGLGFVILPTPGPPDLPLAGNPGSINEVDVAHIGGGPGLPVQDVSVVSVGTGASWRLLSYGTTGSPPVPQALDSSAAFAGNDVKLIALKPDVTPNLTLNLFVAAYIKGGDLWLSSWRSDANGTFTPLDKRGFGSNLGITVEKYGIAQRPIPPDSGGPTRYQIITPILGTQITPQSGAAGAGEGIRIVTWSVNAATGLISGLQASGPWGDPDAATEIAVTPLDGDSVTPGSYALAYQASNGVMETQYWLVSDAGEPLFRGKATSGYTRDGSGTVAEEITQTALLPLTDGGFVTPSVYLSSFTMATWETRLDFCLFTACFYAPYRISDETNDFKSGIGVTLPFANQPTLTNGSSPNVQGGAIQPVRARLTDALWEENFGIGAGTMFQQTPSGPVAVGIASVGKTMTLWLAAEMINDGLADLDDEVTASSVAVNAGGSTMGLSVGDKLTLRDLLYGMMLPSGNDAAFAIGEYLAGDVQSWVDLMNDRAADLGLVNTIYSRPSGGAYSTTQEQTTLWLSASKEPLFLQFAAATKWDTCGEDQNGDPVCFNLSRNPPNYPGWGGYKGGSVGWSIPSFAAANVPLCTQCLVAEATRLGRRLVVMLQQSGSTGGDAVELFDFGFLALFTPDRVALAIKASVNDFALDAIDDGLAVEAHIDGNGDLQVCTYSMFADGGALSENGCSSPRLPSMPGGVSQATLTRVDGVRISTLFREGDYLTGNWTAGNLELRLWRIASKEP
jgi:D-alanyl-D-alanine carboxypeptidase (penicillin-binding protein 5/6)